MGQITTTDIERFLGGSNVATSTWRCKYFYLKRFFDFWFLREGTEELLMPLLKRPERQTFVPHVYTKSEVRALVLATGNYRRTTAIDHRTMRTLILFLYGTGGRLGEVLDLKCDDLNFKTGAVIFRGEMFRRHRTLPLNSDLQEIVQSYLRWRIRARIGGNHLFVGKHGHELVPDTVRGHFARLCKSAGVQRRDRSGRAPRLHELRNTFAVHRITAWIRGGKNLSSMLPALAAYMGHLQLESTERYVLMAPERFRAELDKLSSLGGKKHWRNDKKLMAFVGTL